MPRLRLAVWKAAALASVLGLGGFFLSLAWADQVHRDGFEGRDPVWVKGTADAPFKEKAHRTTEDMSHTGQRSEYLELQVERGTFIYYNYDTGPAPLADDLSASVWIKANRPGVQLLARLVLPKEKNPKNADEPLTAILRGDTYQQTGRWQRLDLRRPMKLAKDQQQLLRAELNKDIDLTDVYVDQLILNVYTGAGVLELGIDDLEIGPIAESSPFKTTSRPTSKDPRTGRPSPNRAAVVKLDGERLLVSGKPFFFRAIRHTDTPLKVLRDAGFNSIWLDDATSAGDLEEAVNQGFWLVPSLPLADDAEPKSTAAFGRSMGRFLEQQDAVLFWDMGRGGLAAEQAPTIAAYAKLVHTSDPNRPVAADVWDGFQPYSRHVELLGVHRWPLMTGLEMTNYREWLNQRRLLAQPGSFTWTWVQTHLPDWYANLVYEQGSDSAFKEPIGPQPEQVRLLTYTALSAGCRGLGFWSDRFLADSHQGRDRLLGMALLNQELQMLEPLLVTAKSPSWINTSVAEIKAAVMTTDKGVLVLPIWMGPGSQFVPGQAAASHLTMTVPAMPDSMKAWLVSPGEVRSLETQRELGGTKIVIPEFGLTAAVVFTSDLGQIIRFQDQGRRMGKLAAQWSHALAQAEYEKVIHITAALDQAGHTVPDSQKRFDEAKDYLQSCVTNYNSGRFADAYRDSQRALRPIRILMRKQWEEATRDLDTPVASPYAVSYFTLPRHWQFMDKIQSAVPTANVLPGGNFETTPNQTAASWQAQEEGRLDNVELSARRVADEPQEGKQCLMLEIKPRDVAGPDGKPVPPPVALERTFLAIHSPAVKLHPGALVQISGWVKIPKAVTASADGVMLYDSSGGEPLALRLTGELNKWKRFTLYRRVPATGTLSVTLALTGIGTAYFDDVRIEPLEMKTRAGAPMDPRVRGYRDR
jgi:hypothetical protein